MSPEQGVCEQEGWRGRELGLGPALWMLWQDSWEQPPLPHSQAGARMLSTTASQAAISPIPLKIFARILAHAPL